MDGNITAYEQFHPEDKPQSIAARTTLDKHDANCDCAVCDDISFRQSVHKTLNPIDPNLLWVAQQKLGKYKEALESIRDFRKESAIITTWPDAFNRVVEIAHKALD